jgi:hypothetical protein
MKKLILLLCLLPVIAIAQPRNCRVAKFKNPGGLWSVRFSCRQNEYMLNTSTCRTGMLLTQSTTKIIDLRSIRCEFDVNLEDRKYLDCRSDEEIDNRIFPRDPSDTECLPGFTVEAVCCRK